MGGYGCVMCMRVYVLTCVFVGVSVRVRYSPTSGAHQSHHQAERHSTLFFPDAQDQNCVFNVNVVGAESQFFTAEPSTARSFALVQLRVLNGSHLDYEQRRSITFDVSQTCIVKIPVLYRLLSYTLYDPFRAILLG